MGQGVKTVYTAIFGRYDDLKEPAIVTKGWKYVVYTDQNFKSNVWEVRKVPVMEWGPAKTARWYKINFHECIESEYSLWVDGTFIINTNLDRWWKRFKEPFTAVSHPYDKCIYKDAQSCIDAGKGNARLIERQTDLYKRIGIPKNNGLIASGVMMRQNTYQVRRFCRTWWEEVRRWTERDQIAWGYPQFQYPDVINFTQWNYQQQREFWHVPHIHKKYRKVPTRKQLRDYASNQRRADGDLGHHQPATLEDNLPQHPGGLEK